MRLRTVVNDVFSSSIPGNVRYISFSICVNALCSTNGGCSVLAYAGEPCIVDESLAYLSILSLGLAWVAGYPKQLMYDVRSQSSPNMMIFHFYITPGDIKFLASSFSVRSSWRRCGYTCIYFANLAMARTGYRNWLGVICLKSLMNYACPCLELSATVDELPQTAPHPIITRFLILL